MARIKPLPGETKAQTEARRQSLISGNYCPPKPMSPTRTRGAAAAASNQTRFRRAPPPHVEYVPSTKRKQASKRKKRGPSPEPNDEEEDESEEEEESGEGEGEGETKEEHDQEDTVSSDDEDEGGGGDTRSYQGLKVKEKMKRVAGKSKVAKFSKRRRASKVGVQAAVWANSEAKLGGVTLVGAQIRPCSYH